MVKRQLKYLFRSISNLSQKKECPNCHSTNLIKVDKKYFVTSLLRCNDCNLQHRHPKDSSKWLEQFYQEEYQIHTHMMTKFPTDEEIEKHKQSNFNTERSFDGYISALFNTKNIKIIDYGCSWGYNVYKLLKSGYEAVGLELSRPRAKFGEDKLGVKIASKIEDLPKRQDLILSSHVIEHLIDLPDFIKFSQTHLNEQGVFMAFCPNGNNEYREREPSTWHGSWGDIHVNLIDLEFAKQTFKDHPYLILSGDWVFNSNEIAEWDGKSQKVGPKKDGKELLIIAKPNIKL